MGMNMKRIQLRRLTKGGNMLSRLEIYATLPVQDLNRARQFYAEKLGMTPKNETPGV
jgi:catechol-2,3-dioxygenase